MTSLIFNVVPTAIEISLVTGIMVRSLLPRFVRLHSAVHNVVVWMCICVCVYICVPVPVSVAVSVCLSVSVSIPVCLRVCVWIPRRRTSSAPCTPV
jgi:hypothetical protein